jgi:DNA primase
MAGRLAIPFIGPRGNVYDIRFRCIEDHDHKDSEVRCPKYLGSDGVETRMYNLQSVTAPTDFIFLTEGELDAATLFSCGWPAVGVPGANAWKPHYGRILAGFSRVVLVADGDDAGRKLAAKVQSAMRSSCHVMVAPPGHDINSLYVERGKDGLAAFIREGMHEDD